MTTTEKLTEKEIAAFKGLDESYVEREKRLAASAPKCHFRPMSFMECERAAGWVCSVCGHVKDK